MTKNEMTILPMITISRSAERTINPKNYCVGREYESYKVSAFRSRQVLADTAIEEQTKISDELYNIVIAEVDSAAKAFIDSLSAPVENGMTQTDLDGVAPFIKMLIAGGNKDDISKEIVAIKDKLNELQLVFLRNLIKTF